MFVWGSKTDTVAIGSDVIFLFAENEYLTKYQALKYQQIKYQVLKFLWLVLCVHNFPSLYSAFRHPVFGVRDKQSFQGGILAQSTGGITDTIWSTVAKTLLWRHQRACLSVWLGKFANCWC